VTRCLDRGLAAVPRELNWMWSRMNEERVIGAGV
jgi:hypothetical protein